jgi:hypothetical protein
MTRGIGLSFKEQSGNNVFALSGASFDYVRRSERSSLRSGRITLGRSEVETQGLPDKLSIFATKPSASNLFLWERVTFQRAIMKTCQV